MKNYLKPQIIIYRLKPMHLMTGSIDTRCICHGHCPCDTNSDPHSNKCYCENRYIDNNEDLFDE